MPNRSGIIRSGLWPLAVFLVFTAAAAWAGYAFFERLKQEQKEVAARTLTSVGKLKAEQIRSYFARDERFALSIARLLGQGGLADWLDGAPSEMPRRLQESLSIVLRNRAGSGFLVLDTTANLRFGAGQFTQLTEEGRRLALRAMTEPQPVISDIYRGDPSAPEQALLDTFVPIQSPSSDITVGVLVMRNDLTYLYDLIQTWPVESPTAESVLVRLDGDHALFLNELRFRKQTALRMRVPLSASHDFPGWPSTAAARGQVGIWEARDYLDHAILAYTLPVAGPVPGWGMVVKMELAEVLAPVQRLKNTTVGVTVSFILVALLALGLWLWLLRRDADREIAERERIGGRVHHVVEAAPNGMLMVDRAGTITLVNAQTERLFGYTRAELVGQRIEVLVPERFRNQHPGHREGFFGTPANRSMGAGRDLFGRRKDGTEFPIEIGLNPFTTAEGDFVLASAIDISERKRVEAALRSTSDRLALATAAAGIGIWDWDVVKNELVWDDQMYRLYGIAADRFTGAYEAWEAGLHPADLPRGREEIQQALRGAKDFDTDFRVVWPDKSVRCIKARAVVKRDALGAPLRMIGTNWDITPIKDAESALAKKHEALEAANKELEAFSYSVSHDLRAPLRGIDGFSQVLLEDHKGRLDVEGRGHLERIRAAAQHMGGLIDDMIMLSRISRAELRRQEVDVSTLVGEVAEELRRREPDRLVSFAIEPGLVAQADPRLLRIALENLLGNAWKFTLNTPEARVSFELSQTDGAAAYRIRDNGAGFDMAYADKLFTPFQRLHSPREFEGTGIGLAIVARVIHRHGGEIRAEGAVGQGATIHFTLGPSGAEADRGEAEV